MAYSDIIRDAARPTIWETLVAMEAQAAHLVPVDVGNLRNSITIAMKDERKQHGPSDDGMRYAPKENEGAIGSAAEYAAAVEFGRADMSNYPAQPYMRPALDFIRFKLGQIAAKEFKAKSKEYENRHPWRGQAGRDFMAGKA